MMRRSLGFCLTIMLGLAASSALRAETDQEVAARQVALELAGAFSNDGFKLRDGHWTGTLAKGESKLIAVNLYAGNDYWLAAGAAAPAKKIALEVFDETGAPVTGEKFDEGTKAASGISVENSGEYFVRVRLEEGDSAGICFVYCYK